MIKNAREARSATEAFLESDKKDKIRKYCEEIDSAIVKATACGDNKVYVDIPEVILNDIKQELLNFGYTIFAVSKRNQNDFSTIGFKW